MGLQEPEGMHHRAGSLPWEREVGWVSSVGGSWIVVRRMRCDTCGMLYVRNTKADLPGEGRACPGEGTCACAVCADTQR